METMTHPLENLIQPLTAQDTCDSCPARAQVAVLLSTNYTWPLLFCGHHWRQHEGAIKSLDPLAVRSA